MSISRTSYGSTAYRIWLSNNKNTLIHRRHVLQRRPIMYKLYLCPTGLNIIYNGTKSSHNQIWLNHIRCDQLSGSDDPSTRPTLHWWRVLATTATTFMADWGGVHGEQVFLHPRSRKRQAAPVSAVFTPPDSVCLRRSFPAFYCLHLWQKLSKPTTFELKKARQHTG